MIKIFTCVSYSSLVLPESNIPILLRNLFMPDTFLKHHTHPASVTVHVIFNVLWFALCEARFSHRKRKISLTANKKKILSSRTASHNKANKAYLQKLSNNSFPILPDVNKLHVFAQSTAVTFRKIQTSWNQLAQNRKAHYFDSCVVVSTSQDHPNKNCENLPEFTFLHLCIVSQQFTVNYSSAYSQK